MMKPFKLTALLCALLLSVLVASCAPAATPAPTTVPPTPTALQLPTAAPATSAPATSAPSSQTNPATSGNVTGVSLFQLSCAACHSADGAGNTFTMDGQTISTPSLHWADLTQTYSKDPSRGSVNDQVALSITKGLDEEAGDLNAMMPRWSSLSQVQVDSLVQYLQTTFK